MLLLRRPVARSTTTAVLPTLRVAASATSSADLSWPGSTRSPPSSPPVGRRGGGAASVARSKPPASLSRTPSPTPRRGSGGRSPRSRRRPCSLPGSRSPSPPGRSSLAWLAQRTSRRRADQRRVGDAAPHPAHLAHRSRHHTRGGARRDDDPGRVASSSSVRCCWAGWPTWSLATGGAGPTSTPTAGRTRARRPGAWLPFGAGPHACPGRNLGMGILVALAAWGARHEIRLSEDVGIDQSRGIAPEPCRFTATSEEPSS